jgi:hypothetical protein
MEKPLGVPKKGAGARLREFYKKLRERPLSPSEKAELIETFKKKKQSDEKAPKKIAKPPRDLELP